MWHIWSKIVRFAVKRYKRPYLWNNVQTDANPPVYRPRMGYSYAFQKIYELCSRRCFVTLSHCKTLDFCSAPLVPPPGGSPPFPYKTLEFCTASIGQSRRPIEAANRGVQSKRPIEAANRGRQSIELAWFGGILMEQWWWLSARSAGGRAFWY